MPALRLSPSLLVSLSPCLLVSFLLVVVGADAKPPALQEYHQSLKGLPEDNQGVTLHGPGAEACVKFEPDGLCITLPAGFPQERPETGVATATGVHGDFEITVSFEILQEPEKPKDDKAGARFSLALVLDRANTQLNIAKMTRKMGSNGASFATFFSLWDEGGGKNQTAFKAFPTEAKKGQLRVARTGSTLSYYVLEAGKTEFTLLKEDPIGKEDLKEVRVVGSTGGPSAALTFRVTDLRIRAESLPNLSPLQKGGGKVWLVVALVLLLLLTLGLGGWLALRHRRLGGKTPAGPAQ